jgi:hypothetical protein
VTTRWNLQTKTNKHTQKTENNRKATAKESDERVCAAARATCDAGGRFGGRVDDDSV